MKGYSWTMLIPAFWLCNATSAEVFKCTTSKGTVSFASIPCPEYVGDVTIQRAGPSRLSSKWEQSDFPHRVNKNAAEILQVSRRRKIIISNDKEISDRMQNMRPPPPGVPSTCVAPDFNSACFDPSGGKVRQPTQGNPLKAGAH